MVSRATEKDLALINKENMRLIIAKKSGEELDYIDENISVDMETGEENDFKFDISLDSFEKEKFDYGNRIFIPGTEYGGIIDDREVDTEKEIVTLMGTMWRGCLQKKILRPTEGESNLILNGELNQIIKELIGDEFGDLFVVNNYDTGVIIKGWKVERFATVYDSIMKLLESVGYKLRIVYEQPEDLEYGYVKLQAEKVIDYSEDVEYSGDGKVHYKIRDFRGGITHLICAGKGENEERIIVDLYVQEDGSIGKEQYYFGIDNREALYEFTSADAEKLEEDGEKRLRELKNYKKMELSVEDMDLELGDIVGGYEEHTETSIKKPVARKILTIKDGTMEIDYKVKGDD